VHDGPDESPHLFGHRLERVLRLPLNRIIAHAESINAQHEGPIRRDYVHYAADIANAGRHMLALVEDLVELQTVESPDFQPARDTLDLADLARKAAGLLTVRAREKNIRIDRPMDGESLPAIGDYRRVLQVLVNLIGNAVRYSPEGSMIWIRTEGEDQSSTVIVADQGRGIDPANHERIFDRFERLNANEAGGSGLGLYISRRLARAMGGDISVDSASGQGARFMLTLPKA
jgi:signal transduction histidine kinase